ncbi:MAG: DUF2336 domain-containing protein [Xanthobacteraceae bacterium]
MPSVSIIDELETAIKEGSSEDRTRTLRQISDLFLHDANRLNDEQIGVFDDVLCLLVEKIEKTALVELGTRLAPVDTAPIKLIKRLARDEEIAIAAPVLSGSRRLSTADLIEIAQTKSQAHLLAISGRPTLESRLTDVLLVRGDEQVVSSLAKNTGANFSEMGFSRLVERAEGDDSLAEIVGLRKDLPNHSLQELLRRATDTVLQKLLAMVPPERRGEIERIIAKVGKRISKSTEHDYSEAERSVAELVKSGKLNEAALVGFVKRRQKDELVVALARLCSAPINIVGQLVNGHRNDAILLLCKAGQVSWPTAEFILHDRLTGQAALEQIIGLARRDFGNLTLTTAQRTLRFMTVQQTVK